MSITFSLNLRFSCHTSGIDIAKIHASIVTSQTTIEIQRPSWLKHVTAFAAPHIEGTGRH